MIASMITILKGSYRAQVNDNEPVSLTRKDFGLLTALANGEAASIDHLRTATGINSPKSVVPHISRLSRKLGKGQIIALHGFASYRLAEPATISEEV